jgi:hypothetical protein
MTNKVKEAIDVLRELPHEQAEVIAEAIIAYGDTNEDVQLSDAQVREIERRLNDPSPRYLTIDQLRDRLQRFGV